MSNPMEDTPEGRYQSLVNAVAERFWRNRQDPGAVIMTDAFGLSIRFTTVATPPETYMRVDLSKTVQEPINIEAAADELYRRYVDQRAADESARQGRG